MIQTTLLLDSSAAMGLTCPELPPTKAIGLRPYLATFVTNYLNASPLALLSIVSMRDGSATTLSPFTNNEDALLDALETRFFMLPPSGMMSLENGLRLCGHNMRLESSPTVAASSAAAGGPSSSFNTAGHTSRNNTHHHPAAPHRPLSKEEEAMMDRTDVECALREAIGRDEAEAAGMNNNSIFSRGGTAVVAGVKREREEAHADTAAATSSSTDANTTSSTPSAISQRRIVVVTGAVSVLDPTNVFTVIAALAQQHVICDVISLTGAPHILMELCRQTKGDFLCPPSGGGDHLRKQLAQCAKLKARRAGRGGNNGNNGASTCAVVKAELFDDDDVNNDDASSTAECTYGGTFTIASQRDDGCGGSVAIGFPTTAGELETVANIMSSHVGPQSAAAASLLALPHQSLCSRCHNPISVPSVCSTCGLLACALPQIHKAFLTLDADAAAEQWDGLTERQQDGEVRRLMMLTTQRQVGNDGGNSSGTAAVLLPSILPPTLAVDVASFAAHHSATSGAVGSSSRPRCSCCGMVLFADGTSTEEGSANTAPVLLACRCCACGGVRCADCDRFVKSALKMCPTCLGC